MYYGTDGVMPGRHRGKEEEEVEEGKGREGGEKEEDFRVGGE